MRKAIALFFMFLGVFVSVFLVSGARIGAYGRKDFTGSGAFTFDTLNAVFVGSLTGTADSALAIDTTYAAFQTYVSNNAITTGSEAIDSLNNAARTFTHTTTWNWKNASADTGIVIVMDTSGSNDDENLYGLLIKGTGFKDATQYMIRCLNRGGSEMFKITAFGQGRINSNWNVGGSLIAEAGASVASNFSVGGETSLGDAATDTVTITGDVQSTSNWSINHAAPSTETYLWIGDGTAVTTIADVADELVLEGSAEVGMTILSATDKDGYIYFSDANDGAKGRIRYDHDGDFMYLYANNVPFMSATSITTIISNELTIGDAITDTLCTTGVLEVCGGFRTATVAASADDVDVANSVVLVCNTSGGSITIGGFLNGAIGAVLHLYNSSTNDITLEDDEGTGNQDIKTNTGADVTITAEGGATLVCDGSLWYIVGIAQ